MNITMSADRKWIEKARKFAARQQTSLNELVRQYIRSLAAQSDGQDAATEFAQLAQDHAGCSSPGYRFERDQLHERGLQDDQDIS